MSRLTAIANSTLGRFLVVGGISFVVNEALLFIFKEYLLTWLPSREDLGLGVIEPSLLVAPVIAAELSILVRFLLNDSWTFRGRSDSPFLRRLYQSNLSSLASPVISFACVNLLTPVFGISYLISNAIGILLGLIWNWLWSTRVIWRRVPDPAQSPQQLS